MVKDLLFKASDLVERTILLGLTILGVLVCCFLLTTKAYGLLIIAFMCTICCFVAVILFDEKKAEARHKEQERKLYNKDL